MAGLELFGGGNDSENENEDVAEIKINEEYARRYEHNKNREDLQRFEELKKRGLLDDDDADSEEDEDDDDDDDDDVFANSNKQDLEFVNAIIKVKNRDPILKNKEVQLFQSDETDKSRVRNDSVTSKRTFLKDVVAQHLIQDGPELEEEEEEEDIPFQSYNEEQEQIRREFLDAAAAAEDDGGGDGEFLRLKDKDVAEKKEDNAEFEKKLDEYFGDDLDDNARFLRDFFKNKMWMQKEGQADLGEEDLEMVSEDEKEIEKQEEYEYRFQENAGDRVLGHSREIEGSVRKKVKARKEQRKSKVERMETARLEREEELRHLKNLKRKENDDKIKKIMEIAGIKDGEESLFNSKELEDEFNPHQYDRMMKKAFGEDYYEAEDDADFYRDMDVEEDEEIEKPNFDKEDELLGLPKDWESVGSGDGFLAAREKILKLKKSDGDYEKEEEQEEGEEEDEEEEKVSEEVKQEKKRKFALLERAKKEMMDEYYKLDYEDTIGDLRTRFKYAKIKPNRYGLSTADILMVDEKDLNQYVPLKMLAPFKETEWKVPNSKRNEMKKMVKEISIQSKKGFKKNRKMLRTEEDTKHSNSSIGAAEHEKEQVGDSNGDKSKLSRNARRRRHQSERKLPISRLMAYGVMPLESKKKAKH